MSDNRQVRVVGHRWLPQAHKIKDFLSRNLVSFACLDMDTHEEARRLAASVETSGEALPLVFFPDGSHAVRPTLAEVARRVGLTTEAATGYYDFVVLGGGPAGLAAAVYGASEGLKTLMVERHSPGGQAGTSSLIENYLGFPTGLSGSDLAGRAVEQARRFGVELLAPVEATGISVDRQYRKVRFASGSEVGCHCLLVATGATYQTLDVPGVLRLVGAGVYYGAAMTEAFYCKGEDVFIVGGGNSAGQAAMFFARNARSVTLLVRGTSLAKSMSRYLSDQIEATSNISVRLRASVVGVEGRDHLESITVAESGTGERVMPASFLFLFIGAVPRTSFLLPTLAHDPNGFLYTGPDVHKSEEGTAGWPLERDPYLLEASIPGVFVAGDARHGSTKRIATAVGEGATAVQFVHRYLEELPRQRRRAEAKEGL